MKKLQIFTCALVLTGCCAVVAHAQQSRDISSSDFRRTNTGDIAGGVSVVVGGSVSTRPRPPVIKKATYTRKRVAPRPPRRPRPTPPAVVKKYDIKVNQNAKAAPVAEQLGVTYWRLRPVSNTEAVSGELLSTFNAAGGATGSFIPERVEAATPFSLGDRVRLTVESPRDGYLYIIDREILAGGTLGDPYLIFPTQRTRRGDNRVSAGLVIDIPGQSDRVPFFTLKAVDANATNYRGEQLTVIISPVPLTALPLNDKPIKIPLELFNALEDAYGLDAEEYEQQGTIGQSYTKAEKLAGCDGKRQLVQEDDPPCDTPRQLTHEDPLPQTVYRVKVKPNQPFLLSLKMSVN